MSLPILWFYKIPIPTPKRVLEIPQESGVSRAKIFIGIAEQPSTHSDPGGIPTQESQGCSLPHYYF